jgi:cellobiose phosphorylase
MYFGPCAEAKVGYAPLSWITGSAGWMYRAIIEFLLGVKAEFYGLKLQPCLPTSWNGASIQRMFRGVKYNIEFIPAESFSVVVDGKQIEGNIIPLFEEGSEHNVICYYVKGEMVD